MDDLLFSKSKLREVLEIYESMMFTEIDGIDPNRLLNTSVDGLCDYFEQEYTQEVPRIDESGVQVDHGETQVDVSRDRNRVILDRNTPFYVTGTKVSFFVPFQGDPRLFKYRPSAFNPNPPRATVAQSEIVLTYARTNHDAEKIKSSFDRDLSNILTWLEWVEKDVSSFNDSVRDKARQRIETRRERLLKDQGLVASLGFPLRAREDAPRTYAAPSVRRKVSLPGPSPSTPAFVPEPTLGTEDYEHILSVISNMVEVMERSPKAFRGMREEDLRHHFLVQLNGQYEGQASGETFNFEGKTDILIRVNGKNIFVGECKFWDGPKSLTKALDQLLSYATWRDTKTALLIFNRDRQFSSVLSKIPQVVKTHPNFRRELRLNSATGFRYALHHRDDPNRELILTVLAFEVPG